MQAVDIYGVVADKKPGMQTAEQGGLSQQPRDYYRWEHLCVAECVCGGKLRRELSGY
jgi:hypothetical protein